MKYSLSQALKRWEAMTNLQVYLSFPIAMSNRDAEINKIRRQVGSSAKVAAWVQGIAYTDRVLKESQIFVFYANGLFSGSEVIIPAGVRNELKKALAMNKRIYLAYKNVAGEMNIYEVKIETTQIGLYFEGKMGSSHIFWLDIQGSLDINTERERHLRQYPLTPEECYKLPPTILLKRKK